LSKDRSSNKLLAEVQKDPSQRSEYIEQIKEEKKNNNLEIEHEIECPRCHDIMTLSSQFDTLCYLCDECDFHLNLN
jgi:phage FluMu protein Com